MKKVNKFDSKKFTLAFYSLIFASVLVIMYFIIILLPNVATVRIESFKSLVIPTVLAIFGNNLLYQYRQSKIDKIDKENEYFQNGGENGKD